MDGFKEVRQLPGRNLVFAKARDGSINNGVHLTVANLQRLWAPDEWGNDELLHLGLDILKPLSSVYLSRISSFRSELEAIGIYKCFSFSCILLCV